MDDVVIVGGGIIGAATAYFMSLEGRKVKVIERDPTYKTASFPLSLGGFRRQFYQKENILLGKFAREFIFKIPELLKTKKNPNPTASMVPNGYLLMFGPEHAEEQYRALENHKECDAGTKNIKGSELNKIFPYINNEGIETATYTDNKSEGWIDPFMFHSALKSKAIELGAEFVKGDVKDLSELNAKTIISAAGCWTKELLSDIPVEPQKHTVFRVKCPKHFPDMPLTGDLTTGVYWRPEGKEFLAGSPISVFDAKDLEPAWNDFEELVWPALAKRVPIFDSDLEVNLLYKKADVLKAVEEKFRELIFRALNNHNGTKWFSKLPKDVKMDIQFRVEEKEILGAEYEDPPTIEYLYLTDTNHLFKIMSARKTTGVQFFKDKKNPDSYIPLSEIDFKHQWKYYSALRNLIAHHNEYPSENSKEGMLFHLGLMENYLRMAEDRIFSEEE